MGEICRNRQSVGLLSVNAIEQLPKRHENQCWITQGNGLHKMSDYTCLIVFPLSFQTAIFLIYNESSHSDDENLVFGTTF